MTSKEIMNELEALGSDSIKKILLKHGAKEPLFGVKIEHLKPIQKKIKQDYALANELYLTKNMDAMYLAGLIADDEKMTKADLQKWVKLAVSNNISEYTVPWVAAGSKHGFELAVEWIDSEQEHIAAAGWCTLSGLVALKPDEDLDMPAIKKLLARVAKDIRKAKGREMNAMNGFVIAVGCYVKDLTNEVMFVAGKMGAITVDASGNPCKLPDAATYIKKQIDKGQVGKKKKILKC